MVWDVENFPNLTVVTDTPKRNLRLRYIFSYLHKWRQAHTASAGALEALPLPKVLMPQSWHDGRRSWVPIYLVVFLVWEGCAVSYYSYCCCCADARIEMEFRPIDLGDDGEQWAHSCQSILSPTSPLLLCSSIHWSRKTKRRRKWRMTKRRWR